MFRSSFRRRGDALVISLLAICAPAVLAAPPARADSLVYVKDGDVRVLDDLGDHRVTTDGRWEAPSQADDGTIVAVHVSDGEAGHRNRVLVRLGRDGTQIGAPVVTVDPNSSQNGPFDAKVSPDGRYVAYWFLKPSFSDQPIAAIAHSDRDTETYELHELSGHWKPFWLDSTTVAEFDTENFPRAVTYTIGEQNSAGWFGDASSPRLAGGDVTRDGRLLATVNVDAATLDISMLATPRGTPTPACSFSAPAGSFQSPTWSPDGKELAWSEDDGVHVAEVVDVADCASITSKLAIPGGHQPDWGPADATAVAPGTAAAVPGKATRALVRKGLPVHVKCPGPCAAKASLVSRGRVIARAKATLSGAGTKTLRLRARLPRSVRSVTVKVTIGAERDSSTVKIRG